MTPTPIPCPRSNCRAYLTGTCLQGRVVYLDSEGQPVSLYATSVRDTSAESRTKAIHGRNGEAVAYVHPMQIMDCEECEATERLRKLPRRHLDSKEGASCHSCG